MPKRWLTAWCLVWLLLPASAQTLATALAPGSHELSLVHAGQVRDFIVHVPRSYRADRPVPLVLALHGGGGSMEVMARDRLYGLVAQSEASGWIVVFPNGFSRLGGKLATWNAGLCCGAARDRGSDDVGFLRAVVSDVQRRLAVDPQRVFATGMSNGGMMSYRLACEASDVFRAIAAVAGTDGTTDCRPGRPVPVFHIHARDDDRVLFNGGSGSASNTHADFVSVPATVDKWARLNACKGPTETLPKQGGVVCEVRRGCEGGAEVRVCVTDTGGHSWPGGRKALGGKGSSALDATAEIWDFFARQ
jgi:polyhydroxybutyrate depolymerase